MLPGAKNTRRASSTSRSTNGPGTEKPSYSYQHYGKMDPKKRQALHEALTQPTKMQCNGFLENLDKNRQPVPINEKRRVKAPVTKDGDIEYVPATYAKLERDDYIIWQAPSKENYFGLWRSVWRDNVKLILCLSDKMSETETDKCYPYWPAKEGAVMTLQNGRYLIKLVGKAHDHKGFLSYELEMSSTDEADVNASKKGAEAGKSTEEEEQEDEKKARLVTVIHYNSWREGEWPNIDTLSACIQHLSKKEVQIMRKSVDQFTPPVILQGHGGIGRTAVAWVATILMKDVERKDCFDIPNLVKKFIRLRPGAFSNKLYYSVIFAVGFRCAGLTNWISEEDSKNYVKDIETAYKESK